MNVGAFQVLYMELYVYEEAAEQISSVGYTLLTLNLCY